MTFLVAAVAFVSIVAILNLALTLGVVRRLREHQEQLVLLSSQRGPAQVMMEPGQRPLAFAARTVDGHEVSRESLSGPVVVGFFSPICPPCQEWIPRFAEAAEQLRLTGVSALAVVVGEPAEVEAEVRLLRNGADVVVEAVDGPVSRAFGVRGFPALCRLDDNGVVVTVDNGDVVAVPAPA